MTLLLLLGSRSCIVTGGVRMTIYAMKSKTMPLAVYTLFGAFLLSSCSSSPKTSSAAPPTVICGKTMWQSPASTSVREYLHSGTYHIGQSQPIGKRPRIFKFSNNCSTGVSNLVTSPSGSLKRYSTAHAKDGTIAAVAFQALHKGPVLITATTKGGRKIQIHMTVG